jgi:hypothetical protein
MKSHSRSNRPVQSSVESDRRFEDAPLPQKTTKKSLILAGAVVLGCSLLIAGWWFKHFGPGAEASLPQNYTASNESLPTSTYRAGGNSYSSQPYGCVAQGYSTLPRASFHAQGSSQSYGTTLQPAVFHGLRHKRHY